MRFLLGGRIVTPYPNTPAVGPDTPDMEFLVHVIFILWVPQPLKTISLSLSLSTNSLSPVTLSPSHSLKCPPSPQTLEHKIPSQINPKTKKASNPPGGPSSPRIPPRGVFVSKFFARERLVQGTLICAGPIYLSRRF